jgi:hypothetical protein
MQGRAGAEPYRLTSFVVGRSDVVTGEDVVSTTAGNGLVSSSACEDVAGAMVAQASMSGSCSPPRAQWPSQKVTTLQFGCEPAAETPRATALLNSTSGMHSTHWNPHQRSVAERDGSPRSALVSHAPVLPVGSSPRQGSSPRRRLLSLKAAAGLELFEGGVPSGSKRDAFAGSATFRRLPCQWPTSSFPCYSDKLHARETLLRAHCGGTARTHVRPAADVELHAARQVVSSYHAWQGGLRMLSAFTVCSYKRARVLDIRPNALSCPVAFVCRSVTSAAPLI